LLLGLEEMKGTYLSSTEKHKEEGGKSRQAEELLLLDQRPVSFGMQRAGLACRWSRSSLLPEQICARGRRGFVSRKHSAWRHRQILKK